MTLATPFPHLSYVSGCAEFWSLALSEEAHEPFQVLGGGRQQELLGDIPRAPQSHAAQVHLLFQFGEQGFDLVARSLRLPEAGVPANARTVCRAGSCQ